MVAYLLVGGFAVCMVWALLSDILTQKISNKLSLLLIAGFVASIPVVGMSLQTIGLSLSIAIVIFALGYVMFLLGGMGAGDVKMMFSTVLWMGPAAISPYIITLAVSSVLLIGLVMAARALTPQSVSQRVPFFHAWLVNPMGGVPYGVPLAIAGLYAIAETPLFQMAL